MFPTTFPNKEFAEVLVGSFDEIWDQVAGASAKEKGDRFEELSKWFLENDPVYKHLFTAVYKWREWPRRWSDADNGIDLIGEAFDGAIWAIQSKGYAPSSQLRKSDIDSFLSEATRPLISNLLLITSQTTVGPKVRLLLAETEKPAEWITAEDLRSREVVWPEKFTELTPAIRPAKTPRPHQELAVKAITQGFSSEDRGQAIMACGTGKTFMSILAAEALDARTVLVLVPSIWLVSQTLSEWSKAWSEDFSFLAVCSDNNAGRGSFSDGFSESLGVPSVTDPDSIEKFCRLTRSKRSVIFSTYQSSPAITQAIARIDGFQFDFAIADEAHRTATASGSAFTEVHEGLALYLKKTLFMTATPRIISEKAAKGLESRGFKTFDMSDRKHFGPVFFELPFSKAIEEGLLVDYEAVITVVDEEAFRDAAKDRELLRTDDGVDLDADELLAMVGLARRIHEHKIRRVITFHTRVKNAERFAKYFPRIARWVYPESESFKDIVHHSISAKTPAADRRLRMAALSQEGPSTAIVSNARVLTEGVDLPSVDAIAFIDPKNSVVDIVQAIGRALRLAPQKARGHILVVAPINPKEPIEDQLDANRLNSVWRVINALRAHDNRLAETLDSLRTEIGRRKGSRPENFGLQIDAPWTISSDELESVRLKIIEESSEAWFYNYGALLKYAEENGHVAPNKIITAGGSSLSRWVYRQRKAYRSGFLSEERAGKLQSIPGWRWEEPDDFDSKFEALKRFSERYGHCEIPQKFIGVCESDGVEQEFQLQVWAGIQRNAYRLGAGTMTPERVLKFEALNGWRWNPGEIPASVRRKLRLNALPLGEDFKRKVEALERYLEKFGLSQVDYENRIFEGIDLYKWCGLRRYYYARNAISLAQIERLEQVPGWTWDPNLARKAEWDKAFEINAQAVERKLRQTGNLEWSREVTAVEVPETGVRSLARWVQKRRTEYRKGSLGAERIARLEAIPGWIWDPKSAPKTLSVNYVEHVALIKRWQAKNGTSRLPAKTTLFEGKRLGKWILRQRGFYNAGELSSDEIEILESIPNWVWDANELDSAQKPDFVAKLSLLREYYNQFQTTKISQDHMPYRGVDIKGWVNSRRNEYKKGLLSESQIAALEEIEGWRWTARGSVRS